MQTSGGTNPLCYAGIGRAGTSSNIDPIVNICTALLAVTRGWARMDRR